MDAKETLSRITSAQQNVSNPERWVSVVAGAAIAGYGLARRSLSGLALAGLGGALLWRGGTGCCPIYESLGISTHHDDDESNVSVRYGHGIRVEKTVTVGTSAGQLYAYWHNFENLPRFMRHLKSVQVKDSKRSHWVVKGPAGIDAEWDAEIINEVPNELIGWRSVDGSNVDNAGSVSFTPTAHGTEVKVLLRYDPPGGAIGAAFAKLFGEDPDRQVQEDLRRFKMLIETGELATTEGQPSGAAR
ncbi:MAG TPA: SRPBCC family protein [Thermoanaerobaculia bacterium]|jgi:uncharacterized membrane protein